MTWIRERIHSHWGMADSSSHPVRKWRRCVIQVACLPLPDTWHGKDHEKAMVHATEGVPSREKAILGLGHWGGGGHRFASKSSINIKLHLWISSIRCFKDIQTTQFSPHVIKSTTFMSCWKKTIYTCCSYDYLCIYWSSHLLPKTDTLELI